VTACPAFPDRSTRLDRHPSDTSEVKVTKVFREATSHVKKGLHVKKGAKSAPFSATKHFSNT